MNEFPALQLTRPQLVYAQPHHNIKIFGNIGCISKINLGNHRHKNTIRISSHAPEVFLLFHYLLHATVPTLHRDILSQPRCNQLASVR